MPKNNSFIDYTLLAAGATKTFDVLDVITEYNLLPAGGSIYLVANITISPTGTPVNGMQFIFNYGGSVTYDGGTFTIFGRLFTAAEALTKYTITCTYINSAWVVKLEYSDLSGISGTAIIDATMSGAKLTANSTNVNKLQNSTRGYLLRAGASGVWETFNAVTSGNILQGNGTDVVSNPVTGDVTISNTGVTTIGASKVTKAMLAYTPMEYYEVNRTFTSAEVLALYSSNTNTGIELLAAPGAGKYIELISVTGYNNYATTTYNAATSLLNVLVNSIAIWTFPNSFIEATLDTVSQGTRVNDAVIALNTGVRVQIATADPTTGDGTITISAIYRIRTV
jgi:hypothetical protein